MIIWQPPHDRHMQGETPKGNVWVRFDREGAATALYFMFEKTLKYLPTEELKDLETIRLWAEIQLEQEEYINKIAQKNR